MEERLTPLGEFCNCRLEPPTWVHSIGKNWLYQVYVCGHRTGLCRYMIVRIRQLLGRQSGVADILVKFTLLRFLVMVQLLC